MNQSSSVISKVQGSARHIREIRIVIQEIRITIQRSELLASDFITSNASITSSLHAAISPGLISAVPPDPAGVAQGVRLHHPTTGTGQSQPLYYCAPSHRSGSCQALAWRLMGKFTACCKFGPVTSHHVLGP